MCSSSSHSPSTHYLPILFSEFFHGPHAIFSSLHLSFNERRSSQALHFPRSSASCVFLLSLTLHLHPLEFFLRCYADAHWCAQSESTRLRKVSLLSVWFSDYAEVNASCAGSVIRRWAKTLQVHSTQCPSIL